MQESFDHMSRLNMTDIPMINENEIEVLKNVKSQFEAIRILKHLTTNPHFKQWSQASEINIASLNVGGADGEYKIQTRALSQDEMDNILKLAEEALNSNTKKLGN